MFIQREYIVTVACDRIACLDNVKCYEVNDLNRPFALCRYFNHAYIKGWVIGNSTVLIRRIDKKLAIVPG